MIKLFFQNYDGKWHDNIGVKFVDASTYLIRALILYSIVTAAIIYICITLIGEITKKQIRKTKVKQK